MFVAPAGHAIGTMRPTLKLADQFDLVLMRAGPTEFALRTSGTTRPVAFEVEHLATAIAMVRHGFGISILPSSVRRTCSFRPAGAFEARISVAVVPRPARPSGERASVSAKRLCVRLSKVANIAACGKRPWWRSSP